MPLNLPVLPDIRRQVRDDIAAHFPGADATVPNSNMRVLADANSGLADGAYRYLETLAREMLPDTAVFWLDRHGRIWIGPKQAATFAEGEIVITGTAGTPVDAGTEVNVGNVRIETLAAATASPGGTTVAARCTEPGPQGNLMAGGTATFLSAIPGVNALATIPADWAGGADTEGTESYRDRLLERIRKPPQGGAVRDYIAWAREVAGVTRAWAAQEMGEGTVTVRFVMDDLRPPNSIPTTDDCDLVFAHIDPLRPVAAKRLFVLAPVEKSVSFTIANLTPDTTTVRNAIAASVRQMLRRRAAPGVTISRSWIAEAVSAAAGEDSHDLTASNVTCLPGEMGVLGTISYV